MNVDETDLYQSNIIYFLKTKYGEDKYRSVIDIYASSDENADANNQGPIDSIFDYSIKRWVSKAEENPNFTIDFPLGGIFFQSYAMKWSISMRYNKDWIVEGYSKSQWSVIDIRNEQVFCSDSTQCTCPFSHETLFALQNPEYYTKLRFTANGVDSCGSRLFSLTQILLFGQYYHTPITKYAEHKYTSIVLFFFPFLS